MGIDWKVVTEHDTSIVKIRNIEWLHPASLLLDVPAENIMDAIIRYHAGRSHSIYETATWTELTEQNPSANRSKLMAMAPACYKWLRENDVEWYEENSPPAKYTNFGWGQKDIETLGKCIEPMKQY